MLTQPTLACWQHIGLARAQNRNKNTTAKRNQWRSVKRCMVISRKHDGSMFRGFRPQPHKRRTASQPVKAAALLAESENGIHKQISYLSFASAGMPVKAQQVATTCFAWWRLGGIMCAFRQRESNNIVVIVLREPSTRAKTIAFITTPTSS
jgi:hypothetical protein